MSWQAYIDSSLVGTGHVDEAGIFDVTGKDDWAHSANFKISPEEMKEILSAWTEGEKVQGNGFHVGGVKYMTIKVPNEEAKENSLVGKKGKEGVVVTKTKQALLIAHHPESTTTPACVTTVEGLGDYLKSVGY